MGEISVALTSHSLLFTRCVNKMHVLSIADSKGLRSLPVPCRVTTIWAFAVSLRDFGRLGWNVGRPEDLEGLLVLLKFCGWKAERVPCDGMSLLLSLIREFRLRDCHVRWKILEDHWQSGS